MTGTDTSAEIELSVGGMDEDDLSISSESIQSMVVAPTDWTIGVLVDLLKKKKIDLEPNYQRRIAWNEVKMSKFIESLFLRLPVPQVVLAEMSPGRFAVIDGKQRLNSIARFCIDTESPLKLQRCEYRSDLNGKTFADLEKEPDFEGSLDAFLSHTVRTTVIKNWKNDELLYLLFLRLNQNSVTLSPQELRRALFPGGFMNWLNEKTAASAGMQTIFLKVPDFRMRDMEVSTRYLGFRWFSEMYSGNMKKFLDDTTSQLRNDWPKNTQKLEEVWLEYEAAIAFSKEIFQDDVFQLWANGQFQSSKNRAVIDVMVHFFSFENIRAGLTDKKAAVKIEFVRLCQEDQAFLSSLQVSTKTPTATYTRFETWRVSLSSLLGHDLPPIAIKKPE
jgi:Protein of unknown function DUF262